MIYCVRHDEEVDARNEETWLLHRHVLASSYPFPAMVKRKQTDDLTSDSSSDFVCLPATSIIIVDSEK